MWCASPTDERNKRVLSVGKPFRRGRIRPWRRIAKATNGLLPAVTGVCLPCRTSWIRLWRVGDNSLRASCSAIACLPARLCV